MSQSLGTMYVHTSSSGAEKPGDPVHSHVVPIQLDELRKLLDVETVIKHAPTLEARVLAMAREIKELQETVKDLLEMIEDNQ